MEGVYYVGCNATSGVNPGSLYYNLAGPPIASGFDGQRIAMVPQNAWMYVMNQAKQGRHNGTSGWQGSWVIAPPGSACTPAAGSTDAMGPDGSYQLYVTFESTDGSVESNAGPASAAVTVATQDINLTGIPISGDSRVGKRNIYATGGTLGSPYLVLTINDNTTTTGTITISDADATNNGITMPTTNDPPPAAAGMVGPYYGRLIAFNTAGNKNRLFWTDPQLPQYWPGAADPAVGNWVGRGDGRRGDRLVHDPHQRPGDLQGAVDLAAGGGSGHGLPRADVRRALGLVSQWGVVAAGPVDYFVGPNGLYKNNLDRIDDETGPIRPLFTDSLTNAGALTPPGGILPGASGCPTRCTATRWRWVMPWESCISRTGASDAQQFFMPGGYHESTGKWFYHRTGIPTVGFQGFVFDGIAMVGLTGNAASLALGYNVDDFRAFYTTDEGHTPIECVFQSHYEDCGLPDNQKVWLEVVIDYELNGDTAGVYVGYDNGAHAAGLSGKPDGDGRAAADELQAGDGRGSREEHLGGARRERAGAGRHPQRLPVLLRGSAPGAGGFDHPAGFRQREGEAGEGSSSWT